MSSSRSTSSNRRRLVLPSTRAGVKQAVEEAERFALVHAYSDELQHHVVLLTSEAVTNAVKHGNERNAEKEVTLELWSREEDVVLCVEDEGRGFDPDEVGDPRAPGNLLKESGRGLFLMRKLADEVHFEQGGRLLRIILRRDRS